MEVSYSQVDTNSSNETYVQNFRFKWKYFLRQLFLSSGIWCGYFMAGLVIGSATVIIPQLRKEAGSVSAVSDEMASWISSATPFASLLWLPVVTLSTAICGRKQTFLVINIQSFFAFIAFYCSTNVTQILICLVFLGPLGACQCVLSIALLPECVSPRYRGFFLGVKSASFVWGIWLSNAIGTFFHWKFIFALAIVSSFYNSVTIFIWPESPYWLAKKGRFHECSKSHKWLKGLDKESNTELQTLITDQKLYFSTNQNLTTKEKLGKFFRTLLKKEFYKPFLLYLLGICLYQCSGKLVCTVYALDIIRKMSGNESAAYTGMLILDGVTVFGMYTGCLLSYFFNRRTLLLFFSSLSILCLYTLSLYLYLVSLNVISENLYVSLLLLTVFSLSASCGPMVSVFTILPEVTPLKYRHVALFANGVMFQALFALFVKLAPLMFKTIHLYGGFLFFAIVETGFITMLYFYLPETKNKTLKEIDDCMKT